MKTCSKCGVDQQESGFTPRNGKLPSICRSCQSKSRIERKHNNGQRTKAEHNAYMREYRIKNKAALIEKAQKDRKEKPHRFLWRQLLARKHNLAISREDFLKIPIPEICPALGIPISYDLSFDNIPSVDRIDPNKPYSVDNIAIVSYRANMIKSIGSAEEHEKIAAWLFGKARFPGKPITRDTPCGSRVVRFGRAQEAV